VRRMVFEPTISVLERAKTFHVLDRAANVIGKRNSEGMDSSDNMTSA
jgi:hypothetical protein